MKVYGNRQVFVMGYEHEKGIYANMLWLKTPDLAGTRQEIFNQVSAKSIGCLAIPKESDQIHINILLPYVAPLEDHPQENAH